MKPLLEIKNLSKSFLQPGGRKQEVLTNLNFSVEQGTILAVTGVSGSGKSTLLHLIGSFEQPDGGEILFNGENIRNFSNRRLTEYRNREIGFLYQFHYLMPELTILENVTFPFLIDRFDRETAGRKGVDLLNRVGLDSKSLNMPHELSGGEKQRAAIARSLINSPALLLADEPTGNLDRKTGDKVFGLFSDLIRNEGLTAIVVTHNESLASSADSVLHLN